MPLPPRQSRVDAAHLSDEPLDGDEFDRYLAAGRRRSSSFLYHTACPQCAACKPTRIPVQEFLWTDSLKRVLRRGDRELRTEVGLPVADEDRVSTFNLHRAVRSLGGPEDRILSTTTNKVSSIPAATRWN